MNLSMKRKQVHRHREQTLVAKGVGMLGNGWSESSELADANRCTQDKKQQDPIVQHWELYSVSYDKP